MNPEPLKNKIRRGFSVKDGKTFGDKFLYDDVKSAVNGLKHDIMTKDLEADNKKDAIKKMCKLVDKWFEDVI